MSKKSFSKMISFMRSQTISKLMNEEHRSHFKQFNLCSRRCSTIAMASATEQTARGDSGNENIWWKNDIRGFLLDIYGVLYDSGTTEVVIEGSVEAVRRLRESGTPFRFCSNTSTKTTQQVTAKLQRLGFDVKEEEIFTPVPAAQRYLRQNNLRPFVIVDPVMDHAFVDFDQSNPNCVVLGDATDRFSYENVNRAFQLLVENRETKLITLGTGKYYKETDSFKLDCGTYAKALEFACGIQAEVIGKPSKEFFMAALDSMKVSPNNAVMIGDDIVGDVQGAQLCGLRGVLVRTGKYRSQDEPHPYVKPDGYVNNLLAAVELFLKSKS
jgi:phospholysine phosphohistidine inorganic pyrophosphate phosphatase